ncbi:hypothetical protein K1W69_10815 [Hoeflea sp. WL0058]|uniref:Uncharacterized protein n=1 Tax=Flavimaribacter sediminis TaxID=2865987 RepID=A0AAE2ZNU0_9HYPH|nr:hypothetical protein [Flavimaribacter sediminis]MBW8637678.1 hypothetical protein [Flavimaribacter sediminis]
MIFHVLKLSALAIIAALVGAGAPRAQTVDSMYESFTKAYGEPLEKGYLEPVDIHYMRYCGSKEGFSLILFRVNGNTSSSWTVNAPCGEDIDLVDMDMNGEPDIRYTVSYNGDGYTREVQGFLTPRGDALRTQGEYLTFEERDGTFLLEKYGLPADKVDLLLRMEQSVELGDQCVRGNFCPSFPEGGGCRILVQTCPTSPKVQEMHVVGDDALAALEGDAEWLDFVARVEQSEGYVLAQEAIAASYNDTAFTPKMTPERQKLVDDWLQ